MPAAQHPAQGGCTQGPRCAAQRVLLRVLCAAHGVGAPPGCGAPLGTLSISLLLLLCGPWPAAEWGYGLIHGMFAASARFQLDLPSGGSQETEGEEKEGKQGNHLCNSEVFGKAADGRRSEFPGYHKLGSHKYG